MLIKKTLFLAFLILITACLPQLIASSQKNSTTSTTPYAPIAVHYNYLPLLLGYQHSVITPSPENTLTPITTTPTTPEPTSSTTPTTPEPTSSTTPTTPEPTPTTPEPTPTDPTPISDAIVADHYGIDEFETIPSDAITTAAGLDTLFKHQSTGQYIYIDGLLCLTGERGGEDCAVYINGPYDVSNWNWSVWDEPMANGDLKTDQWVDVVNAQQQNYSILGMKFCYVDAWNLHFDYYRDAMEQLEQAYPDKTFIWSTAALIAESVVSQPGGIEIAADLQAFNQQLRDYALANNKILFDLAEMESHDLDGNACIAEGYEALCQEYYRDGGGHPNVLASIRIAKGYWWLMARIGGWDGN